METEPPYQLQQQFLAPAEDILRQALHPKIRRLVEYWQSIHPEDGMPGRQHLDPLDVPDLLPNIWLVDVERQPDVRLRYRLIGTNVAQAFDHDTTGEYLDVTHDRNRDGEVRIYILDVIRERMPAWRIGRPNLWRLQDFLRLERIYLPLAGDGRTVDMVLALTVFLDRFGTEF